MKNYKKLLFAGMAIVPLALSSWTSEGNSLNFENGDVNQISSIEVIGGTAVSSSVTVKTKKKIISKETVETVSVAEKSVATGSIETELSFDKIVKDYQ